MWYIAAFALFLFCITAVTPAQTPEQIAEKALAATVYLEMKDKTGEILGFGSGFFVSENLIATNYHVIEGAATGTARLVGNARNTPKFNNPELNKAYTNLYKRIQDIHC